MIVAACRACGKPYEKPEPGEHRCDGEHLLCYECAHAEFQRDVEVWTHEAARKIADRIDAALLAKFRSEQQ